MSSLRGSVTFMQICYLQNTPTHPGTVCYTWELEIEIRVYGWSLITEGRGFDKELGFWCHNKTLFLNVLKKHKISDSKISSKKIVDEFDSCLECL